MAEREEYTSTDGYYAQDDKGSTGELVDMRNTSRSRAVKRTVGVGSEFTPSADEYINNAWKHMVKQDRVYATLTEGHYENNDKGDYWVRKRGGMPSNRPEREQAERWENYVDQANTYMDAARSNRTALGRGNQLLIGEALEDENNSGGGRAGSAIREVRTA